LDERNDMNPIDSLFHHLRAAGRKAFIPFITAGDPDTATTAAAARTLAAAGADLIEIGFPYSDPIADGPVIQASYTRALAGGIRLDGVFRCIHELRGLPVPLAGMVSFSLVHRRGPETFVRQAKESGLSGLIVPDLPLEESESLGQIAAAADVKLIQLVTPTTPLERALRIARQSTGFLYCVSITGITGEREQLPVQIRDLLGKLRRETELPLCVGFGISTPEHVRLLRDHADGVIVGSAIVRRLERLGEASLETVLAEVGKLVRELTEALNPA
jgi:tryptophan synthase alpha chain